jgi:F0F1-type ATP synthase assembly protein I
MVLCGGLYPLIGLLYFLFSYLLIDLIAAILSIPRKLESLAKND